MDIKVEIVYKKIKYLHLRVKDNKVLISAPYGLSKTRIQKFINDNIDYINKQLALQELKNKSKQINIYDRLTILDHNYQVLNISSKTKLTDNFIFVHENEDIRKQIKMLFKEKLLKYMTSLTYKYFLEMNLTCSFPKIIIKDVKSKWGSYNKAKHEIVYASEVIFKDNDVISYLVIHELAHILEFNHSKRFYDIVSKYCPNYKYLRDKLKRG